MKTNKVKKTADKIANAMIIMLVVAGTVAFALVNQVEEGEVMSKMFLVFFGAIITVQIIPGLILLGAMLKGLASLGRKQEDVKAVSKEGE